MGKIHIWSNRLLGPNALNRMTHCGMILKRPGMRRNGGNIFEVAERPALATCWLCREAVGLPKTIRTSEWPVDISVLPGLTQCFCPSGPDSPWTEILTTSAVPVVRVPQGGVQDWTRTVVAQCPGYHMLIIRRNGSTFGVLRSLKGEFTQGKPYDPDFDIGSAAPKLIPSRYDLLMKD
jgi:hypothetical protein